MDAVLGEAAQPTLSVDLRTSPLQQNECYSSRGRKKKRYGLIKLCIQSVGPLKAIYISPPGRPVHSDTNSTSLGSVQPIGRGVFTNISTALSVARFSFLQLSELGCREENENAQASKRQQGRVN